MTTPAQIPQNPNVRALTKLTRVGDRAQRLLKTITGYLDEYNLDVLVFGGAYAPDLNPDLLHNLATAKMVTFVFHDGPMQAPTGVKVTVLGGVTALAVDLALRTDENAAHPLVTVQIPSNHDDTTEYRVVRGGPGDFMIRKIVSNEADNSGSSEVLTTFTTRKQADLVAAELNSAVR